MVQVGEVAFHVQGDIGGIGISRFRFTRQDSASITGTDCNTVAAAVKAFIGATATNLPPTVNWTCAAQVNIYDMASGLVQPPLVVTSIPPTVVGSGGTTFPAGVGARMNWKTSTLAGRRLIKGATFLAPLSSGAFTTSGAVTSTLISALNSAATTYLNALTSAQLYPVVWHRPAKGQTSGGLTGIIFTGVCSSTPASLRSRRS